MIKLVKGEKGASITVLGESRAGSSAAPEVLIRRDEILMDHWVDPKRKVHWNARRGKPDIVTFDNRLHSRVTFVASRFVGSWLPPKKRRRRERRGER